MVKPLVPPAVDVLGPYLTTPQSVSSRPGRVGDAAGAGFSWLKDCTDENSEDGTPLGADFLNNIKALFVTLFQGCGLTVDVDELLAAAIRTQRLNYLVAGGTANALTASLDPAPLVGEIGSGFPLRVLIATTNTSAATLTLNDGGGAVAIVRPNGSALRAGDLMAGQVATLSRRGAAWQLDAPAAFSRINRRLLTVSTTYVPTAGTVFADVEIVGGGGGGGSAYGQPSPNVSAGTGGGAAGYARRLFTAAQIGASAGVVIGAGGAPGPAGQNNGSAGGTSSFSPAGTGGALSAAGGNGGAFGITATTATRGDQIAGGGGASGGDFNIQGSASHFPVLFGGSPGYAISGRGGDSMLGFGGQSAQENANGNPGQGYGSGGSGGAALTVSRAGAVGGVGVCIVTEYIQDA